MLQEVVQYNHEVIYQVPQVSKTTVVDMVDETDTRDVGMEVNKNAPELMNQQNGEEVGLQLQDKILVTNEENVQITLVVVEETVILEIDQVVMVIVIEVEMSVRKDAESQETMVQSLAERFLEQKSNLDSVEVGLLTVITSVNVVRVVSEVVQDQDEIGMTEEATLACLIVVPWAPGVLPSVQLLDALVKAISATKGVLTTAAEVVLDTNL